MTRTAVSALRLRLAAGLLVSWQGVVAASPTPQDTVEGVITSGGLLELGAQALRLGRLQASLASTFQVATARLFREGFSDSAITASPDLRARRSEATQELRVAVGLSRMAWLSVSLPFVVKRQNRLELDGVTHTDSRTIMDGLVPPTGYDAAAPNDGASRNTIFSGASRQGVDQLWVGLGIAPLSQARLRVEPTWLAGVDLGIPLGAPARLVLDNTNVGSGVYEVRLWTAAWKQRGPWTPHFAASWQAPLHVKSDSPFASLGFGANNTKPSQQAELQGGLGVTLWRHRQRQVTVDVTARSRMVFEGRQATDAWELFAYAGQTAASPLALDADPLTAGVQAVPHPGVTNVENYLELGGRLGVQAKLTRWFELGLAVDLHHQTDHALTFADAGTELPVCQGDQTAGCETQVNDVIDPNSAEINPHHVPRIDLVGHRYISNDQLGGSVVLQAALRF